MPKPPPLPMPDARVVADSVEAPPLAQHAAPLTPGDVSIKPALTRPPQPASWLLRTLGRLLESVQFRQNAASVAWSLVLHLSALLALAIMMYATHTKTPSFGVIVVPRTNSDATELATFAVPATTQLAAGVEQPQNVESIDAVVPDVPDLAAHDAGEASPHASQLGPRENAPWDADVLLQRRPGLGGGLQGRGDEARSKLIGQRGGTPASEDAVQKALMWLARHQHKNGSWHFDHTGEMCNQLCRDPGTAGTTTGATALALLPFLGAGQTHRQGQYQEVVKQGLYYLQARMRVTPQGGDFMEGTMYAQGITAIALCEAYALTGDNDLRPYAQQAIHFICDAQHNDGGWRYFPGQPGDTTVFGWQFMALKSAYLAKLEVPRDVIYRAEHYLDTVQLEQGIYYGYLKPGKDPTPTAVGLLARMYLGWPREKQQLGKGVDFLVKLGPSEEDMYFNYYATQVLHHYEGPKWDKWNKQLRDHLVQSQMKTGHEAGSWFFPDKHALSGGRLYTTAMCAMILEVYYRHLPIYGERSVDEAF